MGGKGSSVEYSPPEMTPEEKNLLQIQIDQIEENQRMAVKTRSLVSDFFETDWTGGELSPEQLKRIKTATDSYRSLQETPLNESYDRANTRGRQSWAAKGLSDSTVAAYGTAEIEKGRARDLATVGDRTALYEKGMEDSVRSERMQEATTKLAHALSFSNPALAAQLFGNLSAQRSEYGNQAMQVALSNAQTGGGNWFTDYVAPIAGTAAMFI